MTVEYSVERDLRAIPAEKELLQLKLLRAVGKATDEGVPQRTIAVMLGVAQPEVSRIVKKLRLNPAARERSPREVMLEHAGGRISHEQMLDELAGWEYTFGQVAADDPVASRICGVRGIRSSVRAIFSPTRIVGCCSRPQRSGVRRRMHSDRVEAVAAQLEKMCRPGQLLDKDGGRASGRARDALSRSTTRMSIVERYLAEQTDVAIGRVILGSCDSGATGGGESSSVERRELAGRGWRVIDADRVKDHLLRDAYGRASTTTSSVSNWQMGTG